MPSWRVVAAVAFVAASLAGAAPADGGDLRQSDAALSIAVTTNATQATVGQAVAYTFAVSDSGPSDAYAVVLEIRVSSTATIVGATGPGSCERAPKAPLLVVKCFPYNFPEGAELQFVVNVDPVASGTFSVSGSVTSRSFDPNPDNAAMVSTVAYPVDTTAPANVTASVARPVESLSFPVVMRSTDISGAASYSVRYREAMRRSALGPYVLWQKAIPVSSLQFTGTAGATYCFSAMAVDHQGNVSSWGAESCVAVPMPAASLRRTGPWTLERVPSAFLGMYLTSEAKGATLALAGVRARQLDVLVDTCAGCGVLEVSLGARTLERLSLDRPGIEQSKMVYVLTGSQLVSGALRLRILSSGKPVSVEGVAFSSIAADAGTSSTP